MYKIRKKWLDVGEGRCYLVRLFGGPLYPLEMVGQHANQATLLQRKAPVGSLCSFVLKPQIVRLFIKKKSTLFALEEA